MDSLTSWHCVNARLVVGERLRFVYFPQDESPDLLRVEFGTVNIFHLLAENRNGTIPQAHCFDPGI